MKARRKVVAPVTPRIVQTNPGRRFLQYALLSCAFLLAVWFSYDYGRTRATTDAEVPLAQSGDAERDVTGLEQERDTLRQQVAELVGHLRGKKTGSVRCTRRLMRPADLESRLERERALFVEQIVTAEAMAGIKAWLGDD